MSDLILQTNQHWKMEKNAACASSNADDKWPPVEMVN